MNYITQYEIRQRYQLKALCTNVSCHVCYTLWESEERSAFGSGINWAVKKEIKDKPFDKFVVEDEAKAMSWGTLSHTFVITVVFFSNKTTPPPLLSLSKI